MYSLSSTGFNHSFEVSIPSTSTAKWENHESGAAPCQCFTFAGILTSARLTTYRIEQLEKKVDKHNTVIERTYKLEEAQAVMQEQIKVANNRIKDLENFEREE